MNIIAVFLGGGIGSLVRYGINEASRKYIPVSFPMGTLLSNLISALLIGWLMGLALNTTRINDSMRLLLVTGFCGGFSTFSAFTFETFTLLRSGNSSIAILNIFISVAGCLLFLWFGWKLAVANS